MRALAALLCLCTIAAPALAGEGRVLRVGTSGDYAPFSLRADGDPPGYEGFDVDLARAYAEERGLTLELVPFRWPALLADLRAGAFDVAMSGVTVRPERSAAGHFSHPVALSGAVVLARPPERFAKLEDLDRRIVRIGVNAGGHLEQVTLARFPRATVVSIADNASVREALATQGVDAAVSDTLEAPGWLSALEELEGPNGVRLLGPFTSDRKALLVRADRAALAADLDAWLLERERDGSLQQLRERHLGAGASAPTATPLAALLAAVDERLSLMPWLGVAKRRAGLPLEVPEREALVIDAAVARVDEAAAAAGADPPPTAQVRALFRALIEAAKEVQWESVRDPALAPPATLPDLEDELRPALLRIGDKIARLLVVLPRELDTTAVLAAARDELRTQHLSEASKRAIAGAVVALSHAERAPAAKPPGPP